MSARHPLLAAALATVALAGCGEADEPPLTDTERMVQTTQELTLEAETLEREITAAADELAAGEPSEQTEERLEDQRDRAEELAGRAADELPDDLPVKDELEAAGEQLAAAAEELSSDESGEPEQLAAARAAIGEAGRLQASAAEQLADRPPGDLDELLEQMRDMDPATPFP